MLVINKHFNYSQWEFSAAQQTFHELVLLVVGVIGVDAVGHSVPEVAPLSFGICL